MTLDEAIKHAEEVAEELETFCSQISFASFTKKHCECAAEHRQLAEWLKDYKRMKEQEPITKIEESNFSQEQYLADLQCAYDCGKSVIYKIRAEIDEVYEELDGYDPDSLGTFACRIDEILDKYKAESEEEDGTVD